MTRNPSEAPRPISAIVLLITQEGSNGGVKGVEKNVNRAFSTVATAMIILGRCPRLEARARLWRSENWEARREAAPQARCHLSLGQRPRNMERPIPQR